MLLRFFLLLFKSKESIQLENILLRKQIDILMRSGKRSTVTNRDRAVFVFLSKLYPKWKESFLIFQPDTLIRWHKKGFKLYWWYKSKNKGGRSPINIELIELIKKMSKENPLWGAPRIHGELLMLGFKVSQSTVSYYIPKKTHPSGQSWLTFLHNHLKETISVDFFSIPTLTYSLLHVFVILSHDRRKLIHFNVTKHPTDEWTSRQVIEACPWVTDYKYLIRDRDSRYAESFKERLSQLNIEDIKTSYRSPWQNGYVERVIGSIKRECLDHVIIINENHLTNILHSYVKYYHNSRTHLGLNKNCPNPRTPQPIIYGNIHIASEVGGLHHRYERVQA